MAQAFAWAAVVVAAGRGRRFGKPKQLIEIAGQPMLAWSLRTFAAMEEVAQLVVVTEEEWRDQVSALAETVAASKRLSVVCGGPTRQASTYAGLCAVQAQSNAVFVHDGARPLVRESDVRAGMEPVQPGHATLLAVPVVDTVKRVAPRSHIVSETLDRDVLWAAQTPQFAMLSDLRAAHEAARRSDFEATDDAMLLERAGVRVHVVSGSAENFKVTVPEDRERAEHLLRARLVLQRERP